MAGVCEEEELEEVIARALRGVGRAPGVELGRRGLDDEDITTFDAARIDLDVHFAVGEAKGRAPAEREAQLPRSACADRRICGAAEDDDIGERGVGALGIDRSHDSALVHIACTRQRADSNAVICKW